MGTRKSFAGGAIATTLSADVTAGSTTIIVADASTYPSSANPFVIAINRGGSTEEKVLIGSRSGNNLTVTTRGYDGTTARAHITNEIVEHVLDAVTVDEANAFANILTTRGDQLVYGASGAVRKAKGTAGQVWTMIDGNDPGWVDAGATQTETTFTPSFTGTIVLGTGTGLLTTGGYTIQNGMLVGWFRIVAGTTGFTAGTITGLTLPAPLRTGLAPGNQSQFHCGQAIYGAVGAVGATLYTMDGTTVYPGRETDGSTSAPNPLTAASNVLSGTLLYPVD
jgi:hypothetical protein